MEFIKQKNSNYEPTQARFLPFEEYSKFWEEAPDDAQHTLLKVISLMGIFAGDRSCEIYCIENSNVKINEHNSTVEITSHKRKRNIKELSHTILSTEKYNAAKIFLHYLKLRDASVKMDPSNQRFLRQVCNKTGKFKNQNIGKNYISTCNQFIAKFLGHPDFKRYTGHGFRHAHATSMIENGASLELVKVSGNWESEKSVNKYVHATKKFRTEAAEMVVGKENVCYTNLNPINTPSNVTDIQGDDNQVLNSGNVLSQQTTSSTNSRKTRWTFSSSKIAT